MQLPEHMIGIIFDRFGKEIDLRRLTDGNVGVRVKAAVSGQFYGWLTGLGKDVLLLGPEHVKDGYVAFIKNIMNQYEQ